MAPQYGDNLAYDLSLFEEKKPAPVKEPDKKPEQEPHRARNTARLLRILLASVLVGALLSAFLYSNATLAELNSQSLSLQKQLDSLKDEETRMNVELDSRVCMKDIDEYITDDLGMVKLEKYQVNYLDLSEGDTMELAGEDASLWENIRSFFRDIGEYFR